MVTVPIHLFNNPSLWPFPHLTVNIKSNNNWPVITAVKVTTNRQLRQGSKLGEHMERLMLDNVPDDNNMNVCEQSFSRQRSKSCPTLFIIFP